MNDKHPKNWLRKKEEKEKETGKISGREREKKEGKMKETALSISVMFPRALVSLLRP